MTTMTILFLIAIVFIAVIAADTVSHAVKKFVLKTKTRTDDQLLDEIAEMNLAVMDFVEEKLAKKKKK